MNAPGFDVNRVLYKTRTTKRWWIALALLTFVCVNLLGLLRPERYEAVALVFIHQPPYNDPRINETFRIDDTLVTLKERVTSAAFLSRIAGKLNLDAGIDPNSVQYDRLLDRMRSSIELVKSPDMFKIVYTGDSPREAYNVTDQIVKQFIAQSSDFYTEKARKNVDLLDSQLKQARLQMQHDQDMIKQYKDAHINEIPEAQKEHLDRLAKARDDYARANQDLVSTQNALALARQRLAATFPTVQTETTQMGNPELQQLKNAEREVKMKLDMLLLNFFEDHWQVKETRKQLALIQDSISSATASQTKQVTTQPNPHDDFLQTKINEYSLSIGSLQKAISEQRAAIDKLEEYLKAIPQRQDELNTLDRNYANAASQVEYFQKALNQARLASDVEAQGMGPSFETHPPRMPTEPSSPNRLKIALAAVVLSLGAALGLILLLTWLDRTLRSEEEARHLLRMPLLGTLQSILTPSQFALLRRRRLQRAAGVAVVLVAFAAAGFVAFRFYRDDLLLGMDRMREFMKRL